MRRWEKEKKDAAAGNMEAEVCWQIGQALNTFSTEHRPEQG